MYPRPSTIERIKDKYCQKLAFQSKSLPTPSFQSIDSLNSLKSAIESWGGEYPVVLKSRCNAYDGRGNFVIRNESELKTAIDALCPDIKDKELPANRLYVERFVPYAVEVSVMVAKQKNVLATFPLVESLHVESILRVVATPTRLPKSMEDKAIALAKKAVKSLSDPEDDAGIFGVEMFIHKETGEILLNEVAPRPHNSGHYTLAGTIVSQFEMHLRAILGLPIHDSPLNVGAAVMLNILGLGTSMDAIAKVRDLLNGSFSASPTSSSARASVYFYQKYPWNENRKIGHINVTAETVQQCFDEILNWPNSDEIIALQSETTNNRPLLDWYKSTKRVIMDVFGSEQSERSKIAFVDTPTYHSAPSPSSSPIVGVIMGSDSDLPKMKAACEMLEKMKVPFEVSIVSAHRTPDRLVEYARSASERGLHVIIAGAGGAAHLPGMVASMTPIPVIGVPIQIEPLLGLDSMLSILQMPAGIPVATVAINNSANAALLAIRILATTFSHYHSQMIEYQQNLESVVLKKAERLESMGWKEYKPPQ
jgi:phosphoribosylaminoimidazole carboxylase